MVNEQSRGLQAFRRVGVWFVENPEVIQASGSSAPALARQVTALQGVVTRMTEEGTEQSTQKDQALLVAKGEPALYADLRGRHMKAIVMVATALSRDVPGIGVMRMPKGGIRSEALVKAAEALSTTAAVYEQVLIEHGLPQNFLAQLTAATSALKASIDARGLARSKRVGATSAVAEDFALGRRIVSMIDASLLHALKADSPMLASWRQVRRIPLKASARRADAGTSGTAAVTPAASVPLVVERGTITAAPATDAASTSTMSESVAA